WNPKNVPSSRVFLRGSYYYDFDLKDDPFYQLQVGYSILLSEIINSKKLGQRHLGYS
ncbi:MAG: hypothetical protein RLZZ69_659, partial [Cyanobacteriota bacterium]